VSEPRERREWGRAPRRPRASILSDPPCCACDLSTGTLRDITTAPHWCRACCICARAQPSLSVSAAVPPPPLTAALSLAPPPPNNNSAAREKYGLLEKRKDYLLRARDFHRKERTLKRLQRKAEERNPDEFYHAMQNKRTKGGVFAAGAGAGAGGGDQANKYSQEELALMRTQDAGYVGSRARSEAATIERMRASLHFVGATDGLEEEEEDDDGFGGSGGARPAKRARHTVFVDSPEEAETFSPEAFFDTPGRLLGRAHNRPRKSQLKMLAEGGGGGAAGEGAGAPAKAAAHAADTEPEDQARLRRAAETAAAHERALVLAAAAAATADAEGGKAGGGKRRLEKARAAAYAELALREDRRRKLRRVQEHLELVRQVAGSRGKGSGRLRKLRKEQMAAGTPGNVKVFKWKRERKR